MKNKKGFTLIELLAVIVILAIIALIAVPIILNMISQARKSAARSAALGYVDAIEYNNGFANAEMDGYTLITGTKNVSEINVKMKGKKPDSGSVTITNDGKVESATLCINGYNVTYTGKDAKVEGKCDGTSNNNTSSQVVYYYRDALDKKIKPESSWPSYIKETNGQKTASANIYEFTRTVGSTTMHSADYGMTYTNLTDCQSAATEVGAGSDSCVIIHAAGSTYMDILYNEVCLNSSTYGGELCLKNNEFAITAQKIKNYFGFNENTWTKTVDYAGNRWTNSGETITCYINDDDVECQDSSIVATAESSGYVRAKDFASALNCQVTESSIATCAY